MSEASTAAEQTVPQTARGMLRNLRRWDREKSLLRGLSTKLSENSSVARRQRNAEGVHPALRGLKGLIPAMEERLPGLSGVARVRMGVVLAGLKGQSVSEIAVEFERKPEQVVRWFRAFRASEIEAFAAMENHRPAAISYETLGELRGAVEIGSVRTAEDARAWLEQRAGLRVGRATVFRYLRKADPKRGRAKK